MNAALGTFGQYLVLESRACADPGFPWRDSGTTVMAIMAWPEYGPSYGTGVDRAWYLAEVFDTEDPSYQKFLLWEAGADDIHETDDLSIILEGLVRIVNPNAEAHDQQLQVLS